MKLKLGDRFRIIDEGRAYKAILAYNRLDEKHPYLIINSSNYEVIDAYEDIESIPVFDLIPNLATQIIDYQKDGETLAYSIVGDVVKLYYYNSLFESTFYVFDDVVTEEESIRLQSLFHAFKIIKTNVEED